MLILGRVNHFWEVYIYYYLMIQAFLREFRPCIFRYFNHMVSMIWRTIEFVWGTTCHTKSADRDQHLTLWTTFGSVPRLGVQGHNFQLMQLFLPNLCTFPFLVSAIVMKFVLWMSCALMQFSAISLDNDSVVRYDGIPLNVQHCWTWWLE